MKKEEINNVYGLLGKNISYSFSVEYFSKKFSKEQILDSEYRNFDIPEIQKFPEIISKINNLKGMNVTIPYKEDIIPFLDNLDNDANEIKAVNTIKIQRDRSLRGFNTDIIGFRDSLKPMLQKHHSKALILGTGGASKAVAYALRQLDIAFLQVSRNPTDNCVSYRFLTKDIIQEYSLIINCTPLGTFPNTENCPDIPYEHLSNKNFLYDLIYNPSTTSFLKKGLDKGALIKNGLEMLKIQAEASWKIWNH